MLIIYYYFVRYLKMKFLFDFHSNSSKIEIGYCFTLIIQEFKYCNEFEDHFYLYVWYFMRHAFKIGLISMMNIKILSFYLECFHLKYMVDDHIHNLEITLYFNLSHMVDYQFHNLEIIVYFNLSCFYLIY